MRAEREAADGAPHADTGHDSRVQQAVERFVELHSCGEAPDPLAYVAGCAEHLRPQVLARIREFLRFDGLLGHQPWQPAPGAEAQGRAFGDFVIQEELGRGGMGVVYLAQQRSLNRRVALKVMASGLVLSRRHVERFRREAAATAQLRHPAIVAVHSLTEVDGTYALAMDYVAGRNLADILDDLRLQHGGQSGPVEGPLGLAPDKGYVAECALFAAQLASALATAHQANVVHRDLKPRNVMLDDRRQVRLLDFGLAKSLGEGSISMSGEITGTVHYMSPEQTLAKRVEVDHRADVWALGVMLYEMLTLCRPFDGKNLQQVVYEICFKEPAPLQRRNPKVPRDLVTIVQKALEKDPQNRYQSAAEFEADLQRFLRWEPIHARPAGPLTRAAKWMRRHRTESAIAAALAMLALVALGWSWYRGRIADGLLATGEQYADAGRFHDARRAADEALALRNDAATRARAAAWAEAEKRIETEAAWQAQQAIQLLEHDREQALRLALRAETQHSSPATRSAVLEALGSGHVVRTLRPEGADGRAVVLLGARWSPDGVLAATVGFDGHAVLWDPQSGRALVPLRGHAATVPVVGAVFAGADHVVTAAADQTLRRWRTADGGLDRSAALPGATFALRAARDGARVLVVTYAAGGSPFTAQVWDTTSLRPVSPPVVHGAFLVAASLSPCGELAATSAGRGDVRLWRVDDGAPVATLADHLPDGAVRALVFAPDSRTLATAASDGVVRLYATGDGRLLASVAHSREVGAVAFDRGGDRLLTGSHDLTARLWQLEPAAGGALTAREVATLVGHSDPVTHVAFDPGDQLAVTATGGQHGVLRLFDVGRGRTPSGHAVQRYEVGPSIEWAEFAPDGRSVLALAAKGRAVVWDFGSARGVVTLRQPGAVPAVAFDAAGQRLCTAGDDEQLRLWSAADGRLLWQTRPLGSPVRTLDVDPAGERIAASTVDGRVRVHRLADGEPLYALPGHHGNVPVVRFVAGGQRLLTAGAVDRRGLALLWNTNDQSPVARLERPAPLVAADVTADGAVLATVEADATVVRLWSMPDGAPRGELGGHEQRITSVRFAPDGAAVLTASHDGTARLQTLAGAPLRTFAAGQRLHAATFSRDGSLVLTCAGGSSPEAQLWRTADGSERFRFHGHRGAVDHGAFSPDGTWAATCARDGTTCIWPTDPVATAGRLPLAPR